MRDLRIPVFPTTTLNANSAFNGQTIDLEADYANGNHAVGTSLYGLGGFILLKNITASGVAFTVVAKSQISSDGTTWTDHETIGTFTILSSNKFSLQDGTTASPLTRQKLSWRIRTGLRYCRIVLTPASISGTAAVDASAFLADGSTPLGDTGILS